MKATNLGKTAKILATIAATLICVPHSAMAIDSKKAADAKGTSGAEMVTDVGKAMRVQIGQVFDMAYKDPAQKKLATEYFNSCVGSKRHYADDAFADKAPFRILFCGCVLENMRDEVVNVKALKAKMGEKKYEDVKKKKEEALGDPCATQASIMLAAPNYKKVWKIYPEKLAKAREEMEKAELEKAKKANEAKKADESKKAKEGKEAKEPQKGKK